ncbi:hypothetical protein CYMTET_4996 [Cymbomonas tetramitiformis]|uniref:Uncharacterized protein n=1 Tax=Cymbomonas tetramitiformis TaxID=36881 RepID=A0AAE0H026_9CHLO|nr:hypothetical protein CYMTET_4996 [Cymbomonas tetramitiformis]
MVAFPEQSVQVPAPLIEPSDGSVSGRDSVCLDTQPAPPTSTTPTAVLCSTQQPVNASEAPALVELSTARSLHTLLLKELIYWYGTPQGCPVPTGTLTFEPYTDSAQVVKRQLLAIGPRLYSGCTLTPDEYAFRERLQWTRLRAFGARHTYLVVYTADGYHRLLVLKVPPRKFSSPKARQQHASRQMTYHDTGDGLYAPGVRYTEALYDWFLPSEEPLRQACREGHRMHFVAKPARFKRDNHPTCYEHSDRSEADLVRSAERGVLEGPLHYEPWCTTQIGSLYCPVKDKFRNIWNARTSRVNEAMAPAPAVYDYLEPVLSLQRPGCSKVAGT